MGGLLLPGGDALYQASQRGEGALERGPVVQVLGAPDTLPERLRPLSPGACADRLVPGLEIVHTGAEENGRG